MARDGLSNVHCFPLHSDSCLDSLARSIVAVPFGAVQLGEGGFSPTSPHVPTDQITNRNTVININNLLTKD